STPWMTSTMPKALRTSRIATEAMPLLPGLGRCSARKRLRSRPVGFFSVAPPAACANYSNWTGLWLQLQFPVGRCFAACRGRSAAGSEAKWMRCRPGIPPAGLTAVRAKNAGGALRSRSTEVMQIRRRLILLRGHEVTVGAEDVGLAADEDVAVILEADVLDPDRVAHAAIAPGDGPRTRQGMIDGGDLVAQDVGRAQVDPLLDHGLIVLVQRDAARIEDARALEVAGLDLERVQAAAPIGGDPFPHGIAGIGRLELLRPDPPP